MYWRMLNLYIHYYVMHNIGKFLTWRIFIQSCIINFNTCTFVHSHSQSLTHYYTCTLMYMHPFILTHSHIQRSSVTAASSYPTASHTEGLMLCLQWFICLGVIIALSILGGWHVYLISVSETTIEFYTNKRDARVMRKEGKVCIIITKYCILYTRRSAKHYCIVGKPNITINFFAH